MLVLTCAEKRVGHVLRRVELLDVIEGRWLCLVMALKPKADVHREERGAKKDWKIQIDKE